MNLSHRTERGHDRAVSQAAAAKPADLPDMPQGAEEWLAAKMAEDAKESPKFTQHGNVGQCRREDTEERILSALTRRMTSPQIAKLVGMSDETIRRNMARMHMEGKVRREGPRNSRIWSKV
jgi:predicted HTH transcriptional regulator